MIEDTLLRSNTNITKKISDDTPHIFYGGKMQFYYGNFFKRSKYCVLLNNTMYLCHKNFLFDEEYFQRECTLERLLEFFTLYNQNLINSTCTSSSLSSSSSSSASSSSSSSASSSSATGILNSNPNINSNPSECYDYHYHSTSNIKKLKLLHGECWTNKKYGITLQFQSNDDKSIITYNGIINNKREYINWINCFDQLHDLNQNMNNFSYSYHDRSEHHSESKKSFFSSFHFSSTRSPYSSMSSCGSSDESEILQNKQRKLKKFIQKKKKIIELEKGNEKSYIVSVLKVPSATYQQLHGFHWEHNKKALHEINENKNENEEDIENKNQNENEIDDDDEKEEEKNVTFNEQICVKEFPVVDNDDDKHELYYSESEIYGFLKEAKQRSREKNIGSLFGYR